MSFLQNNKSIKEANLEAFLSEWPLTRIKNLRLSDYVLGGKNRKNTFSYWLEEGTSQLGGIGGIGGGGAFRYGIYIQKNIKKYRKNSQHTTDGKYAWVKKFGKTPEMAFKKIKNEIVDIVENSSKGRFDKVDNSKNIFPTVRWKIAYLYSQQKLMPFYSLTLLKDVARHLGFVSLDGATRAELQIFISKNWQKKYKEKSVLEFPVIMWKMFGPKKANKIGNDDPYVYDFEGREKRILREHIIKERSAAFRNKFKKKFQHIKSCPACNFSALRKYGISKSSLLEMHHIVQFSKVKKERKITEKDVALLCPNCHRAIHKIMSEQNKIEITILVFKKLIRK